MNFYTRRLALFLSALLSGIQAATAQDRPQLLPFERVEQLDPAIQQQQRLLNDVRRSVTRLDANGDRTMDAIENVQVTLTLDTMDDSSRLAVICNNGGKSLSALLQSLAESLQLSGKVREGGCTGAGRDDNPFVMTFHLHYESGQTSLSLRSRRSCLSLSTHRRMTAWRSQSRSR